MKRGTLNMVVDLASLAVFIMVVSTGLVLDLMLPPGSGRLPGEGGSRPEVLLLWGMSRHQWGVVHWWFSFALLLVLALHLGLHWRFFKSAFRRGADPARRRRLALGICALVALLSLAVAPFLSPVTTHSVQHDPLTTGDSNLGALLYERDCQSCHSLGSKTLSSIPEGPAGVRYLRNAQPEKPHLRLREMSDQDLREMARYLREQSVGTPRP